MLEVLGFSVITSWAQTPITTWTSAAPRLADSAGVEDRSRRPRPRPVEQATLAPMRKMGTSCPAGPSAAPEVTRAGGIDQLETQTFAGFRLDDLGVPRK